MPQALQQVRDQLGDEAVILNTRKLTGRERSRDEQVEITAALESQGAPAPAAASSSATSPSATSPAVATAESGVDPLAPRSQPLPFLSRMYGGRTAEEAPAESSEEPPVRRLDLASIVPRIRPEGDRLAGRDGAATPLAGPRPERATAPAEAAPTAPERFPNASRAGESLTQLHQAVERMERLSAGLSLPPQLSQLAERLRRAGLSETLVRDCVHGLFQRLDGEALDSSAAVARSAAALLKERLPGRGDIRIGKERRVVGFVGASGAGKTTAIAKIAAGFAAKMRKRGQESGGIVIISTDTRRVGGLDQARSYAELIGVPLEVVYEAPEMRAALERHHKARLVLIDTPGCGAREVEERQRQQHLLEVAGAETVHVVVDGLTGLDHMLDLIAATDGLGDRRLLFSKIDEVLRPGALLSAAVETGLQISYLTAGPALPGGIRPGELDSLVDQVVEPGDGEPLRGGAMPN